jgi:hypothetical protein
MQVIYTENSAGLLFISTVFMKGLVVDMTYGGTNRS